MGALKFLCSMVFAALTLLGRIPDSFAYTSDPVSLELVGLYRWQLLFNIQNRNNSEKYTKKVEFDTTLFQSYTNLQKKAFETAKKGELNLDLSGVIDVVSVGFKQNVDNSISKIYESTVDMKIQSRSTKRIMKEFVIGPNSKLAMYRLVFFGPGVSYATETVSSSPLSIENVVINCQIKQKPLLKNITVVYSGYEFERPENLLEDSVYGNSDINAKFGEKFVWLTPVWTTSKDDAATSFEIVIQGEEDPSKQNLAAGTEGAYRYLIAKFDPFSATRIQRVGLLRGPMSGGPLYLNRAQFGWDECTSDINKNRGGDYLYVCWNTVNVWI